MLFKDGKRIEPKDGFYATTAVADHAIEVLKEHQIKHADKPFFSYVAFTAPHFPLQALPEDIARVGDRYKVGLGFHSRSALGTLAENGAGQGIAL